MFGGIFAEQIETTLTGITADEAVIHFKPLFIIYRSDGILAHYERDL
jgi:hypothetical protein